MSEQLDEFFVISGISTEAKGTRVFLAYDAYSGGYSQWTKFIRSAERFSADKINAVFQAESNPSGYMAKGVDKMVVLKVSTVAEEVSLDDFRKLARAAALAKLTKEDKIALGLEDE